MTEIKAGDVVKGKASGTMYDVVHVDGDQFWGRSCDFGSNFIMRLDIVTRIEPFFKKGKKYTFTDGAGCCTYEVLGVEDKENGYRVAILRQVCKYGTEPNYVTRSRFSNYREVE